MPVGHYACGYYHLRIQRQIERLLREALSTEGRWDDLRNLALSARKPQEAGELAGLIPLCTFFASGGKGSRAVPAAAAWQLVLQSAKLFDDLEDNDAPMRGGRLLNLASGLLFLSDLLLIKLADHRVSQKRILELIERLHLMELRAGAGQHLDLGYTAAGDPPDPDTWLKIAGAKSGALFAWAAWAGSVVAGAEEKVQLCYDEFGYHLGILLQIGDDYNGLWRPNGPTDLAQGRLSLPVCYTFYISGEEKREAMRLALRRARAGDLRSEGELKSTITSEGGVQFMVAAANVEYKKALALLKAACPEPESRVELESFLNRIMPILQTTPLS